MSDQPPPLPDDEPPPPPGVDLPTPPPTPNIPEPPGVPDSGPPEEPPLPPIGGPPTPEPESNQPKANPLPFLVLIGIVLLGTGVWYWIQQQAEDEFTAGQLSEKKIKPYKGEISEEGKEFVGIWKGFDADEDTPTNWEMLRNSDNTFSAVYRKTFEEDRATLTLSGTWKVKSSYIHYKVKAEHAEGPDLEWPGSWKETIGDISGVRLKLQSLKTEARRGPLFECRAPGFGYREAKTLKIPAELLPPKPVATEKAAEEVPGDMLIHYDFNESTRNLSKKKHQPKLNSVTLTQEDLPPTFGRAIQFGEKESSIEITDSDELGLAHGDFSISLWLRVKGNRADGFGILDSVSSGKEMSLTGIGLRTLGSGKRGAPEFMFYHRDAKYRFQGKTKLNDGKWHHVAVTKAGYLAQIYVNGQPEGKMGSIYRRTGSGTTSLSLGKFIDTGLPNGALDNFRLYMRTLSPEEILAIYESERFIAPDLIAPR